MQLQLPLLLLLAAATAAAGGELPAPLAEAAATALLPSSDWPDWPADVSADDVIGN